MRSISLVLIFSLFSVPLFSQVNTQTQKKATTTKVSNKNQPQQKRTASQNKKKGTQEKPKVKETPLPYNSNDCLFALEISADTTFGPTTPPNGGGRVMEIMRDPQNTNLFEYEHNTVWYKLEVPYTGRLIFEVTPTDPTNDYDFLLYKYTDQYFCNRVASKRIKPLLSNLSKPDSAKQGKIGASEKGTKINISKASAEAYTVAVPVVTGETYYLVLDNVTPSGKGHSIKYSVHVDFIKPKIKFIDSKDRRQLPVEILVVEKNTENRVLLNNKNFKGGEIRFVPGFDYALYIKKDGYFSYYEDFNSLKYLKDTLITIPLVKIDRGTIFEIPNIYFEEDFSKLSPLSDTTLLNYVQMFENHPEVNFEIKGYIQSYGFDIENDMKISQARANSVMDFFARHGIDPSRMAARGMTKKEIQVMSNEVLNKNKSFTDKKIEIIIKSIDPSKKIN